MAKIISDRSVYFFNQKERVDIRKGESILPDNLLENPDVKGFIADGIVRVKGPEPVAVDELSIAKADAEFWKASYEALKAAAPKQAAKIEAGTGEDKGGEATGV